MRNLRCAAFLAISALVVVVVDPVQAKVPEMPFEIVRRLLYAPTQEGEKLNDHDPHATTEALRALFAVSNAVIPASSSCRGHYGETGKATVKGMLAVWMSNLGSGKNVIQGNCQSGQCAVIIIHEAGEDVSSASITFDIVQGKASVPTLQCLMTP